MGSHVQTDCGFHPAMGQVLTIHVVTERLKLTDTRVPMAIAASKTDSHDLYQASSQR